MIVNRFVFYNILRNMPPKYYYAVAKGRNPGIYNTWDECKTQVYQFSGPIYKKFSTQAEAKNFIVSHTSETKETNTQNGVSPLCKRYHSKRARPSETDDQLITKKPRKTIILEEFSRAIHSESKKEAGEFIVDDNGYVNVYTDGACSSNGNKNAKAGIGVWFGDAHPLNVSEAVVGRATNNMAEIQAVTVAAQQAKKAGIKNLKINTDSKFLISCINNWMPKWKSNGWKTVGNKPVINKKELLEMEKALKSLNVTFNHINGHVGIHGNEMADKLARLGCSKY